MSNTDRSSSALTQHHAAQTVYSYAMNNQGTHKNGRYVYSSSNISLQAVGATTPECCTVPAPIPNYKTVAKYSLSYYGNGSNGGSVPVDSSSPYLYDSSVIVLDAGNMTLTNNFFSGWNTLSNGKGTTYLPGSIFVIRANTILYAQWIPYRNVTYDGNGSTSGSVPVDPLSPYLSGSTVTVLDNIGNLQRTDYVFNNWAIGTVPYLPGSTFVITSDTIIVAQWTPLFMIIYYGNGATGTAPVDYNAYFPNTTATILNKGALVNGTNAFTSWNTNSGGTGQSYFPDQIITVTSSLNLYAQWAPGYTVTYLPNGGTGTVPVDPSSPYVRGATVIVLDNTGGLVKTGYVFIGWSSGVTFYHPGDSFIIMRNTTLTAQWSSIYSVTYLPNGGTGAVPVDPNRYLTNDIVTVLGNTGPLIRIGYIFSGWNYGLIQFNPGDTFLMGVSNVELIARWISIPYTVTYNANGGISGTLPIDTLSPYVYNTIVNVLPPGTLARTAYVFSNWNTAANGSGFSYFYPSSFPIQSNVILYAQWIPTYTVLYNGNGATGGTVPIDTASPYVTGSLVIVKDNTGGLVKTGSTFQGWNTLGNGTGTPYPFPSSFTITSNVTLYAQWTLTPLVYTVVYTPNGGTGAVPVDPTMYLPGSIVTVLGNTGPLTKPGYVFTGWNDGLGHTYVPGNTFTINANTTLAAQWALVYTVTYDGNGSTGGSVPVDPNQYLLNAPVTVLSQGTLSLTNFIFVNWNTAANGSGTTYNPNDIFNITNNTTLYAQWVPSAVKLTVTYDGNGNTGGSAPVDPTQYSVNATVTVLDSGTLENTGFTFDSWNDAMDGSGNPYNPGGTFQITVNTTLYAQWV